MYTCVDKTQRFGSESVQIRIIGSDSIQCDICEQQQVVYGLCGEVLNYSESQDGMYLCVYPFEYIDNKCVCAYGHLLNNSKCINITESLNNISNSINSGNCESIQLLELKVQNIENKLNIVDQSILGNVTEIEKSIISNNSKLDFNLMMNISTLDNRIHDNITSIKNDILITQIIADNNLLSNTTVLDWRIFNNVSQINIHLQNLSQQLIDTNNTVQQQNQIIQQQYNIINNLTQYINCTSNYGYSLINGSCIQVTCAIQGQQSINGICQCTNINSIIQADSCVCPSNSNVIGTACVCSISGQTMMNGTCICVTRGAFVKNNVCTCGVDSFNISNVCGCPSGATSINGVCMCENNNAYISGNQCICPEFSQLIGDTCMCPNNSVAVNNTCVCNQISDQIMNNGVCSCQTIGAFVKDRLCTCGDNLVNISNTCKCPANASLVNSTCVCDQIVGQLMIGGICQCPSDQVVIGYYCQTLQSYVINNTNFECNQKIFTTLFDINSITYQINATHDFNSGYVFNTPIKNSFIDISNNVYTVSVIPLFQSQNVFENLKIQIGIQIINSGSLIQSSSTSIIINQMNIISKPGSQLTLNSASQINILSPSSNNASINNLLVHLIFAPSQGNITLINQANGIIDVLGYQVLGSFITTQTVAMIAIHTDNAVVHINQVNFEVNSYDVGNCSSYLFSKSVTSKSEFYITNMAVIQGNNSNFLVFCSLSSTTEYYYQFGGIIAYINNASTVVVDNIIVDSYLKFSTDYVTYSGYLVGYMQSSQSSLTIQNMCIQQSMTSVTQKFYDFGLIGRNVGNSSIQNASLTLSDQGVQFNDFGIIGAQNSIYAEIVNIITSITILTGSGQYIGSNFGYLAAKQCLIQNISMVRGNISSNSSYVGGFIGFINQNTNLTILDSTISKLNISGYNTIAGYIGFQITNTNTTIAGSKIYQLNCIGHYYIAGLSGCQYANANMTAVNFVVSESNVSGQDYVAGLVGSCVASGLYLISSNIQLIQLSTTGQYSGIIVSQNSGGYYQFINAAATQNYINKVLQNDCPVILNTQWQNGC
ncbi:Conserved_hypothetical protein [Hexamita inflata]|uniref:Uncharacterized protein n=1 Tax=Hexamita inflata TaxID=28002 RepID=A0AA86TST8_9EUKA|nr:Conserved hypothetical protein [Hexamita inflata]